MRLSLPSAIFVGIFSQAPSATSTEPKELSPAAAGGEGFGRKTPAVVTNNTMSNGHRLTCDPFGALSKRRQNKVRFALFRISPTPSDQVDAEPTEAGEMFSLPPSGSETLSNAVSQF